MKNLLASLMAVISMLAITGCNVSTQNNSNDNETKSSTQESSHTGSAKEYLQAVLDSKKTFISRDGGELYLKDYTRYDGSDGSRSIEYTYVDFDDDGQMELVLMMSSDISGGFLVLHSNGDKVYGYDFHWDGMLDLKQDGSFIQHTVDSNRYCNLSFEGTKCKATVDAVHFFEVKHYEEEAFELNGRKVSKDEFNKFKDSWEQKENVVWKSL